MRAGEFVLLVPAKSPGRGKSRLAPLGDTTRRDLAKAFLLDTVDAALGASTVGAVLVVTDDHVVAGTMRARGCAVLPDGVSGDLNESLRQAAAEARRRWPDARPAAVCADLPALTAPALDAALTAASPHRAAFVRDHTRAGTTLYTAEFDDFRPRFGVDSARAHAEAGATELLDAGAGLRTDVDCPADLAKVADLGVGRHTARLLTARRSAGGQ